MTFHNHMKQRLFSPKFQKREPVTNVFRLEITSPCKDPFFPRELTVIRVGPQGEKMTMWLLKTCSDFERVK